MGAHVLWGEVRQVDSLQDMQDMPSLREIVEGQGLHMEGGLEWVIF